jgi:hypothetical protein
MATTYCRKEVMQYKRAKLGQGCYKVLRPIISKLFVRLKVPGREYVSLLLGNAGSSGAYNAA